MSRHSIDAHPGEYCMASEVRGDGQDFAESNVVGSTTDGMAGC